MPRVVFIAEAPSHNSLRAGHFAEPAWFEFKRMLQQVSFPMKDFDVVYLFDKPLPRPFETMLVSGRKSLPPGYALPPIRHGKYFPPQYVGQIPKLYERLALLSPEIIVPLDATPLWLMTEKYEIGKFRGQVVFSKPNYYLPEPIKIIATYAPESIAAQWSLRPVAMFDLLKIMRHLSPNPPTFPVRELYLEPTVDEVREYLEACSRASLVSFDVETKSKTITCIGFSHDPTHAMCIPFYDPQAPNKSFYSALDELRVWKAIRKFLRSPVPKVAQNGLYDIQYLRQAGLDVMNYEHDTMILHHALYSELPKGLQFLASIYTEEQPWKLTRNNDDFKEDA
jgi:hypothetical protein